MSFFEVFGALGWWGGLGLTGIQCVRQSYPGQLNERLIRRGVTGVWLVWGRLEYRPDIGKVIRNRRHRAGAFDWGRSFRFCCIDSHLDVGQLFTAFLFGALKLSFGRFPALVLQPVAKTKSRKQMMAHRPNSRQSFISRVSELNADRVDGDDARRLQVVDRPFGSTLTQAG